MEADYSTALTLLLRYPVPGSPHGPSSFVGDALYLRKNLLLDGGAYIVSKYSGKAPKLQSENRLRPKSANSTRLRKARDTSPAYQGSPDSYSSPLRSPARLLQRQGGIEAVIQEAAKGVYSRGEKWGVNKAIRGAVQGLQSGNSSPRRESETLRWSLDADKNVAASPAQITAGVQGLEERNIALAKMLENAMEGLWVQQKEFAKQKANAAAEALSLAIAKVQFVQVYLEDPTMSLPAENVEANATEEPDTSSKQILTVGPEFASPIRSSTTNPEETAALTLQSVQNALGESTEPGEETTPQPIPVAAPRPMSSSKPKSSLEAPSKTSITTRPETKVHNDRPRPSPFHHPRPSLAQSSFSWMLGEDQLKSSFVSASPFPSEKRRQIAGRGDLFGEEKNTGKEAPVAKGKEGVESGNDEGFTLRTLKGIKEGE